MAELNMDAIKKLIAEREANRLKAAQERSQNPEPYNPRAEWLKQSTENSMNRKTPLTAEEFLQQMGGMGSTGMTAEQIQQKMNENPYFQQNAMGSQRTYGGNDSLLNATATSPVKGSKENPYRQGDVVSENGQQFVWDEKAQDFRKQTAPQADQSGPTGTAKVAAPPTRQTAPTPTQGNKIFTGNTIDTSKDPNNLPYNNPEANKPILPTDYAGQISLPTAPEEMQLMDYLKKQFEDKTWENKYADLQKQYQQLADRPDKYSGMIEKAGGEDVAGYIKSLYEGAADPLRREAQRMQEQNAADLAARGLGMSTVVSDVNNPVQRELLANLTDLSNRANVQGRDMYLNALRSAADVYGQSNAQQGNILNAMQTNIGNQMGAQQLGLGNIQKILADQEARRLTNMQTGINQWDKTREDYWKYFNTPQNVYSGQNATANTAAGVGGQIYSQANTNAAGQNQLVGNVGAAIGQNLFKQPQNTAWQPISTQTAQSGLATAQNAFKKIPVGGGIS